MKVNGARSGEGVVSKAAAIPVWGKAFEANRLQLAFHLWIKTDCFCQKVPLEYSFKLTSLGLFLSWWDLLSLSTDTGWLLWHGGLWMGLSEPCAQLFVKEDLFTKRRCQKQHTGAVWAFLSSLSKTTWFPGSCYWPKGTLKEKAGNTVWLQNQAKLKNTWSYTVKGEKTKQPN